MAEDNKDEWSSGQPARPNEETNTNTTSDFTGAGSNSASSDANAEASNAGVGNTAAEGTGSVNGGASDGDNNEAGSAEISPSSMQETQNFNTTPTEVFSTGYRPDDANAENDGLLTGFGPSSYASAANETGASDAPSSATSSDNPYRPAPEYGAYGPSPSQFGNNNGQQSSPTTPLNGIFGNGRNANNGNGYGNSYNNAQGQPNGSNVNGNGGNFGGPNMPNGNGYGNPGGYGNGNGNANGNGTYGQTKSHSNIITAIVAAVVAAVLCLGVGYAAISNGWVTVPSSSSMSGITSNKSGSGSATVKGGQAPDWAAVSAKVSDSVVSITTQVSQGTAKGSGAVIDDKGHIVTNNHVISGAQDNSIQVTLSNGQMYKATVVGTDTTTDLAVVQIQNPPSSLKPVEFADSSKLAVGENVMAVGNPLGYDDTATTGIVSALNRPVSVMDDNHAQIVTNAVQIDAAINPGNSGGPTFNVAGQVIGINSSIASASSSSGESGSIGIGFAIPSNLVKRVADQIVSKGSVEHAMLGVTIKSATVESDGITRGGAQITTPSTGGSAVVKGSPADKAGLKADDTVVAFNGQAVGSSSALLGYVRAASLGDKVKLTIVRGGKTMDVDVTLDQKESDVSGSNRSESEKQNSNGQGQQGQGNGQNGQGQQGQGNGNDDGDGGGLFDPFGLW
ncbi:trypsin-like peptidase domain-containing protein [Bifidobacterium sp. ESL0682]|uniref:S1C family serine protease n=1 Tax=Bifidobacterium sp. ESL0682 TaxID=2983212 RepID=UPI0023F72AA6|nr:trypsin-like peptidase domain-containing protein [Bifidobacterium sp. ESL0682]WEV41944.1 trypsin-like peptidase domain-containing protein [Bifidobacterium sp. ESL0682]